MGEINVPEHNWKAWPSVPKASTVPTLLKMLVVSGKPFVTACTGTGDKLTIRSKTASSELILFLFGIMGIPFYISTFFSSGFGVSSFRDKVSQQLIDAGLPPLVRAEQPFAADS